MPITDGPVHLRGFRRGGQYTRNDVFDVLGLEPHPEGGNWFTGYHSFGGAHYVFCNVGAPGRTGHEYGNRWEAADRLRWFGKGPSTAGQSQIRAMTSGAEPVYLFYRDDNRASFRFAGIVRALRVQGEKPVEVLWQVMPPETPLLPEEIERPEEYYEGAKTRIVVNSYERDRAARDACVDHYGYQCRVCDMDFETEYGEIGKDFIHVHHRVLLSSVGENYRVDPIEDLRPVCPNCHAMLHQNNPPLEVEELRDILQAQRSRFRRTAA